MNPVLTIAIEPKDSTDRERLLAALDMLGGDVVVEANGDAIVLGGFSEMELDDAVDRVAKQVAIKVHPPEIAYRETITRTVEHDYTHKRRIGDIGEFARILFRIEPSATGEGISFVSKVRGNLVGDHVLGVETGFMASCGRGREFPVTDLRIVLLDGAYHDTDSSILSFKLAAQAAFPEAYHKGRPVFLEPIMSIEVTSPVNIGEIIADLNARRGQIRSANEGDGATTIGALVPLGNLFGYASSLRRASAGVARYALAFSHYERVPAGFDPDDRFRPAMAMRA